MPQPVIAIDFDDTLVRHDELDHAQVVAGAREALIALKNKGYRIVIHTCRTGLAADLGDLESEVAYIEQTLDHFGIPYDEIFHGQKVVADIYIDDRAVPFHGRWDETLDTVLQRLAKRRRRPA